MTKKPPQWTVFLLATRRMFIVLAEIANKCQIPHNPFQ